MSLLLILLAPGAFAFDPAPSAVVEGVPLLTYNDNAWFVGDLDGDGHDEVLLDHTARLDLRYGSASGPSVDPDLVLDRPIWSVLVLAAAGIGDVNGDGYDDLAIGHWSLPEGDDLVEIRYGSSMGVSLLPDQVLTLPNEGFGAAVVGGDVDGDGLDDLLVGASGSGDVHVFLGDPAGLASAPDHTFSGSAAGGGLGMQLVVGEIDGDGNADLLVGGAGYPSVFLGLGTGAFRFGGSLDDVGHLEVWDVDGDGRGTPVTAAGKDIVLHEGSEPAFSSTTTVLTDPAWAISGMSAPGDLDGDGYDDLVLPTRALRIVAAGGPVPTTTTTLLPSDRQEGNAALGDFDGDGTLDLLTANFAQNRTELILDPLGAADGHEWRSGAGGAATGMGGWVLPVGDVDGDGADDVASVCPEGGSTCVWTAGFVVPGLTLGPSDARAAADVDGDGFGDLVLGVDGDAVRVHRGGPGGLDPVPVQELGLPGDVEVQWMRADQDLDADGHPDLTMAVRRGTMRHLVVGLGSAGGFRALRRVDSAPEGAVDPPFLGFADVDGDGFPDLFGANAASELVWRRGSASGPSGPVMNLGVGLDAATSMVVGDFDQDGHEDVALTTMGLLVYAPDGPREVLYGSPTGPDLARVQPLDLDPLWAGDLDGDGIDDLVTSSQHADHTHGTVALLRGTPAGLDGVPVQVVPGADYACLGASAAAADIDGDGLVELLLGGPCWGMYAGRLFVHDQ